MYVPIQYATGAANKAPISFASFAPVQGPQPFARSPAANVLGPEHRGAVAQVGPQPFTFDLSTQFGRIQGLLKGRLDNWPQGKVWQTQVQLHGPRPNLMTVYGTQGGVGAIVHQMGTPPEMLNPFDPAPSYSLLFTSSSSLDRPVVAQWGSAGNPMSLLHPSSPASLLRLGGNVAAAVSESPYLPAASFNVPTSPIEQGNGLANMPAQPVMISSNGLSGPEGWDPIR